MLRVMKRQDLQANLGSPAERIYHGTELTPAMKKTEVNCILFVGFYEIADTALHGAVSPHYGRDLVRQYRCQCGGPAHHAPETSIEHFHSGGAPSRDTLTSARLRGRGRDRLHRWPELSLTSRSNGKHAVQSCLWYVKISFFFSNSCHPVYDDFELLTFPHNGHSLLLTRMYCCPESDRRLPRASPHVGHH